MSKMLLKDATWYALAGLFVAVALLPILKASSPQYFPEEPFKGCNKGTC